MDGAFLDQGRHAFRVELRDGSSSGVQHPRNVREHQEGCRIERGRHPRCGVVCIDVDRVAIGQEADRSENRGSSGGEDR